MPLDTATFISQLSPLDPTGGDPVSQGDNQIRDFKQVMLNTTPALDAQMDATSAQLNQIATGTITESWTFSLRVNADGGVRLPNTGDLVGRNVADTGDVNIGSVGIGDTVLIGDPAVDMNLRGTSVTAPGPLTAGDNLTITGQFRSAQTEATVSMTNPQRLLPVYDETGVLQGYAQLRDKA